MYIYFFHLHFEPDFARVPDGWRLLPGDLDSLLHVRGNKRKRTGEYFLLTRSMAEGQSEGMFLLHA